MKTLKACMALVACCSLLFTSCSQEEAPAPTSEKASLSFGALLNDLVNNKAALKQVMEDTPACSDATPAFVEIVLSGPENVGSMDSPLVVAVNNNPGNYDEDPEAEYFTEEAAELQLEPGTYSLDYFAVYDGDPADPGSNLIWLAPAEGGGFAGLVEDALPMSIPLAAGAKKYADVGVVCFDDRLVNEYGYLFFDIENTEAIEFCIFGNFCPPSGRHYPAAYSVDVWSYADGSPGALLHSDLTATVALEENGDYAASPVCMMLPDTDGLDEYYFEITLMDSDAYGNITESIIRHGVMNDAEARSFFDGENNLEYYHFKEGCGGDDEPPIFQDPDDEALHYKACLTEIGDSNAVAFAYLRLEGNTLETHVFGFNLEANKVHPQHIHGLAADVNAACDNPGPPVIALNNELGVYPSADSKGMTSFSRTYTLGSDGIISREALGNLENRNVNVHGRTIDGTYVAGHVVACAEIEQVN